MERAGGIEAILLAGPTASGKSALALALADAVGGEIVNADSMQVYAELQILSARPGPDEVARAPHALYGVVSAYAPFSTGKWLAMARNAIAAARAAGRVPIVVGGTGLYFRSLEQGLSPIPDVDPAVREAARRRRAEVGADAFYAELERRDPATAATLDPGDAQRMIRAWEVLEQTGRPLILWQSEAGAPAIEGARAVRAVLDPPRPWLNSRIDARFDAMMAAGALDEARAFWSRDPDPNLPAAKALGLPQLKRALHGEIALDEAVALAKTQTRRYAKRQGTWFRHQTPDWTRLVSTEGAEALASLLAAVRNAA